MVTAQQESRQRPWLEVDWNRFDPWRVTPLTHRLYEHPLLAPASLVELGRRLEARRQVRTHSGGAQAGTPFNDAPRLHPNRKSAVATLSDVEHANAWTSLLNIQTDDEYRTLVDTVLGEVKPHLDRVDPGMSYRAGWIFVTSPNAVTPFHMDKEHNFIMQVQGRKRLYVWPPDDKVAVSEVARDLFHATHSRAKVHWSEELRKRAIRFDLVPGMGAYMPSTSPHLVENGDGPSITASFTFYTHATRRNSLLHLAHHYQRRLGLEPPDVGARPLRDTVLHSGLRMLLAVRSVALRLTGRGRISPHAPYAVHRYS
jgi:hypothetical protein